MKIKYTALILAAVLLVMSFSGCQLKKEPIESSASDRLIGALITTKYLDTFDIEAYLQNNIKDVIDGETTVNPEDEFAYQNKIYAKKVTMESESIKHDEYVFDIEGFWVFDATIPEKENDGKYTVLCGSDEISDVHIATYGKDDGEELTVEATVYYTENNTFYLNPVFQETDGDVYTVAGQGVSSSGGGMTSSSLSDEVTINNGETKETYKSTVKMNYVPVKIPKRVTFAFMKGTEAISKLSFLPEEVPEKLKAPNGAEYVLVLQEGESVVPVSYGKENETADYLRKTSDGFCSKHGVNIEW